MKIKDRKWKVTDDKIGIEPKFRIFCEDCFNNAVLQYWNEFSLDVAYKFAMQDVRKGWFDMFLRQASLGKNSNISDRAYALNMFYKCNECDKQKLFGVPISSEYYMELRIRRGGSLVYTPIEEWMKNPDMKEQLKGLGYL